MARSSGTVIEYAGTRGRVYRIKFVDASGRRVSETLGHERDGWNRKKAEEVLHERLVDVKRAGYRRPDKVTFQSFAEEWSSSYPETKGLKRSTVKGYKIIVRKLIAAFGSLQLHEVDAARIDEQVARWRSKGAAPSTVNANLSVLSLIMKSAVRRRRVQVNPVPSVDRPKERQTEWRILTPSEIKRVALAFDALIAEAETDAERDDLIVSRRMFLTLVDTGIRRGELLGLRWRHVSLADPAGPTLRIAETFVRHAVDTPKSVTSRRTLTLSSKLADELFEHRGWTSFEGDDEYVFCNPRTGHPSMADVYAPLFRKALAKADIEDAERIRPFHDLRHSSITNGAAASMNPHALQQRAGHSSYGTTQRYVALAGVDFREEAELLAKRLWGEPAAKESAS